MADERPNDPFPDDVQAFLWQRIETYEELEVLLLAAAEPSTAWDADSLAARLRLSPDAAAEALGQLAANGLMRQEKPGEKSRYAPAPREAEIVARLAGLYRERRLDVVKIMSANAIQRVRTAAMRTFSDAFLLDRRKKHDG